MSNKNVKAVKTEKAVINLDEIIAKANSAVVKEKNSLSRASLYKYSEEELLNIKRDKDEGKKLRNKIRKDVDRYMSNILGKARRKDETLIETIDEFKAFYEGRFLRNDFSLSSLREEKSLDENSRLIFTTALEIIKAHL
jgi:hypothetical protein